MVAKFLTKNPVLMIGILAVTILMFDLNRRGYFNRDNLMPTSCRSALVKLDRRIPDYWSTSCQENTMNVVIDLPSNHLELKNPNYKPAFFRELANALVTISTHSPNDNLERVDWIKVSLKHKGNQVDAISEGKFLSKLSTMKDSNLIAQHIHNTVKVKELFK